MAVHHLDADLADADWTKQTWDLPTDVDEFVRFIAGQGPSLTENMRRFMTLPAALQMPDELRADLINLKLLPDNG